VQNDGGYLLLVGDFMVRSVTREIALPLTISKPVKDSSGKIRIGLEAAAKLNLKDYGIKYNKLRETGVPDLSDEIELEINAEAIKDTLPKDNRANQRPH